MNRAMYAVDTNAQTTRLELLSWLSSLSQWTKAVAIGGLVLLVGLFVGRDADAQIDKTRVYDVSSMSSPFGESGLTVTGLPPDRSGSRGFYHFHRSWPEGDRLRGGTWTGLDGQHPWRQLTTLIPSNGGTGVNPWGICFDANDSCGKNITAAYVHEDDYSAGPRLFSFWNEDRWWLMCLTQSGCVKNEGSPHEEVIGQFGEFDAGFIDSLPSEHAIRQAGMNRVTAATQLPSYQPVWGVAGEHETLMWDRAYFYRFRLVLSSFSYRSGPHITSELVVQHEMMPTYWYQNITAANSVFNRNHLKNGGKNSFYLVLISNHAWQAHEIETAEALNGEEQNIIREAEFYGCGGFSEIHQCLLDPDLNSGGFADAICKNDTMPQNCSS